MHESEAGGSSEGTHPAYSISHIEEHNYRDNYRVLIVSYSGIKQIARPGISSRILLAVISKRVSHVFILDCEYSIYTYE